MEAVDGTRLGRITWIPSGRRHSNRRIYHSLVITHASPFTQRSSLALSGRCSWKLRLIPRPALIDMNTITTSEQVSSLAISKRTHSKLRKVAKNWNLEYIDIYNQWYPFGCSRDFLIPLVELSGLVGEYTRGRQILVDCKKERIGEAETVAKGWALVDAKSAVSKAKELGSVHIPDNTIRPRRTESVARHARGSVVHDETRAGRKRNRLQEKGESIEDCGIRTLGRNETSAPTRARSTEPAGTVNTEAQWDSDAVIALVDSLETSEQERRKENTALAPSAAPCQFPLTPSSATAAEPKTCSVPKADNLRPRSSPLQPAQAIEQDNLAAYSVGLPAVETDLLSHSDTVGESAEEAAHPVFLSGAQSEWTNDDRTDMLLRAFNRDPSHWYVMPTQMLEAGRAVSATLLEPLNAEDLPKMILIPVRGVDKAPRTLIIFDRARAHGIVFDAGGCNGVAKVAWGVAQTLLTRIGILQGEASMDLHPFLPVHLDEGVSYGILLIIAALHKLHEKPLDSVSPRLWRGLLAGFFPDGRDTPQERLERLLADFTKLTSSEADDSVGIERNLEDAESLDVAKTTINSYAEQARLLLQMTESQLDSRKQRNQLVKMQEWLSAKPADRGAFRDDLATLETNVSSQLATLPEIPEWCEQQLCSVQTSCRHTVDKCERTVSILKARRIAVAAIADAKYKLLGVRLMSMCT
jgi:hypothetical protein